MNAQRLKQERQQLTKKWHHFEHAAFKITAIFALFSVSGLATPAPRYFMYRYYSVYL